MSGVRVWRSTHVSTGETIFRPFAPFNPSASRNDDRGLWFPLDPQSLAELRETIASAIAFTNPHDQALTNSEADTSANAVLRVLGLDGAA